MTELSPAASSNCISPSPSTLNSGLADASIPPPLPRLSEWDSACYSAEEVSAPTGPAPHDVPSTSGPSNSDGRGPSAALLADPPERLSENNAARFVTTADKDVIPDTIPTSSNAPGVDSEPSSASDSGRETPLAASD
eukprot:RCo038523